MLGEPDDSPAPLIVAGDPILASETDKQKQPPAVETTATAETESSEDTFPVNPRTILEAMLFVGRADNASHQRTNGQPHARRRNNRNR